MIKTCPNCGKVYKTELERPDGDDRGIQNIFPFEPSWKREQLLSGICSDKCWNQFLGGDECENCHYSHNCDECVCGDEE